MHLSIVPNFENKIFATDKLKKLTVDLRSLPAIELTIALQKAYPSHQKPLMALRKPSFYKSFENTIMSTLLESWVEDTPCLYDIVCRIQDEIIPTLLEQHAEELPTDGEGNIKLVYETTQEF